MAGLVQQPEQHRAERLVVDAKVRNDGRQAGPVNAAAAVRQVIPDVDRQPLFSTLLPIERLFAVLRIEPGDQFFRAPSMEALYLSTSSPSFATTAAMTST